MLKLLLFCLLAVASEIRVNAQDSNLLLATTATDCQVNSKVSEKPECVLYPNPTQQKFNLKVKGFSSGTVKVIITEDKGTLVREEDRLLVNGEEVIPMYVMLPPGNYFVILQQKGKKIKKNLFIIY